MKKLILFALMMVNSLLPMFSQNTQRSVRLNNMTPEKMVKKLDRAVHLNQHQKDQLYLIFQDYLNDMNARLNSMSPKDIQEKKELMHLQVNTILTQKQQQKWTKWSKPHTPKGKPINEKKQLKVKRHKS